MDLFAFFSFSKASHPFRPPTGESCGPVFITIASNRLCCPADTLIIADDPFCQSEFSQRPANTREIPVRIHDFPDMHRNDSMI
jgi:hypothetical protein